MKICIDARGISWYKGTGIGTYTENLIKELLKLDKENFYNIYWSGDEYENFRNDLTKIILTSKKHKKFFEHYYFPENIFKENIALYHIPQNGIGLDLNIKCKKIVTIHDLIPYLMPETVGKGYLKNFLKEMPYIIENSDAIITVSNYSKKDILKLFPHAKDKVYVTPLSANSLFRPLNKEHCKSFLKNKYNIKNPFILYLGGFSERKNVASLIKAYKKAYKNLNEDLDLVLLGSYKKEGMEYLRLRDRLDLSEKVIFPGYIHSKYLPIFYNACEFFIYPSFYEGFGLPPLEAMKCGTPVITSNLTSIPEVVGDSALLIDPYNIDDIEKSIELLSINDNLRTELSTKALNRSNLFSWENTAKLTLDIYNKMLKEG